MYRKTLCSLYAMATMALTPVTTHAKNVVLSDVHVQNGTLENRVIALLNGNRVSCGIRSVDGSGKVEETGTAYVVIASTRGDTLNEYERSAAGERVRITYRDAIQKYADLPNAEDYVKKLTHEYVRGQRMPDAMYWYMQDMSEVADGLCAGLVGYLNERGGMLYQGGAAPVTYGPPATSPKPPVVESPVHPHEGQTFEAPGIDLVQSVFGAQNAVNDLTQPVRFSYFTRELTKSGMPFTQTIAKTSSGQKVVLGVYDTGDTVYVVETPQGQVQTVLLLKPNEPAVLRQMGKDASGQAYQLEHSFSATDPEPNTNIRRLGTADDAFEIVAPRYSAAQMSQMIKFVEKHKVHALRTVGNISKKQIVRGYNQ